MILMKEYKRKINQLVIQLTHLERNKYIINLAQEAAKKFKEMVKDNGTIAEIISIVLKD